MEIRASSAFPAQKAFPEQKAFLALEAFLAERGHAEVQRRREEARAQLGSHDQLWDDGSEKRKNERTRIW